MSLSHLTPEQLRDGIAEALEMMDQLQTEKPLLSTIIAAGIMAAREEITVQTTFGGDRARAREFFDADEDDD
jgi:hypothetical protein